MARGYGDRTGMDVWYPIYPPITEVNITTTLEVIYETYCKMVEKYGAEHIAIVGDSMGGLFAAGVINQINRSESPVDMPKLFIANSPAGVPDTNEDWEEIEKYARKDPFFDVSAFRGIGKIASYGQKTPKDTYFPIHMDFHNAPKTYMYFAEEVCAGNARAYRIAYKSSFLLLLINFQFNEMNMNNDSILRESGLWTATPGSFLRIRMEYRW